jgi:hypothetical protein
MKFQPNQNNVFDSSFNVLGSCQNDVRFVKDYTYALKDREYH